MRRQLLIVLALGVGILLVSGVRVALFGQTGVSGITSPLLVASGAKALATSVINSGTCTTAQTDTATGTLTTDVIAATFNADPTATTGYSASTSGMLTIIPYPTSGTVNFKVCNNTSGNITPGAVTINWKVLR